MTGRIVVLCTVGSGEEAQRIASNVVERRLAACVNVLPGVVSVYRWKEKVQRDDEWLLVMKTTAARFEALRKVVVDLHPYDVPEVIQLSIEGGHDPYLEWIDSSVAGP